MSNYPPGAYAKALGAPDETMWNAVDNKPPVARPEHSAG
jgi:hypothetical protein